MESFEKRIKQENFLQRVNIEKSIIGSKAFYINEDIEKGVSIEDILIKAKSGKYFDNDTLEKGKPAQVGEVREWNGVKYRKVASGKWEEVHEIGRESSIAINTSKERTATQIAGEKSKLVDAAERKKVREKYEAKALKRDEEIEDELYEHEHELRDLMSRRKDMDWEMEEDVAAAPEEEKDNVGNEWGETLNSIDEEISEVKSKIAKLESEREQIWDLVE